jgi:N-methylhydantoinase A
MARIMGIRRFMVPKFAAGLSAFGGLISDVRWEETGTHHTTGRDFDLAKVNALLGELIKRGKGFLKRAGFAAEKQHFELAFQGRYLYQSWDIEVPFELPHSVQGAVKLQKSDVDKLVAAFHRMHERIYTIKDEADTVEFTTWKVRAIGDTGGAQRTGTALSSQAGKPLPKAQRPVFLGKVGERPIPVYAGESLLAGAVIQGPAIVEQPTTTILLLDAQTATVNAGGDLLIEAL